MGCKILSEGGGAGPAALYDSVTMVAFGPVMPNATWAEGFLGWLGRDPRPADGQSLIDSWAEYERTHAECGGCGINMARRPDSGEALCEECGADEGARLPAPQRRGSRYHMASSPFSRPALPDTAWEPPREKWRVYAEPLRGTDMFVAGHPNLGAILDWVNANFHRRDLGSQSPVAAALPGGGTVTAPSFRMELTMNDLRRWYAAFRGTSSLDAPMPDGDLESGGTVGESLGSQDQAIEDREEYRTRYISDPENNARIRRRLEAAIHEAAATAPVDSANLRKVYETVLLVKLGFASKPAAREQFEKAWREDPDAPHIPFRAELISNERWRDLGRPLRKGWENDKDQGPHRRYRKPWTQKVLVHKDTGGTPKNIRELRKDPDPDHWKIVKVEHTTAEEPKPEHFVNWVPYTEKDRDADIRKTLDAYDGDEWFRMSLQPQAQRALLESLDEGDPLRNFKPEDMFTPYAKIDVPMWRALGQVRPSVQRHTDSLSPGLSGPGHDMKSVTRELVRVLECMAKDGDPDAPWVLAYMAQKRQGKVAVLRARPAKRMDTEPLVGSVVSAIFTARGARGATDFDAGGETRRLHPAETPYGSRYRMASSLFGSPRHANQRF